MAAIFGPAGTPDDFATKGFKKSLQIPKYINEYGLDCFEYQCGRGVKVGEAAALEFGEMAKQNNVKISLHAPYYISMSSIEEEKRLNSVKYIIDSAKAVNTMGGNRIVVHTGSCGKISREEALELAKDTMTKSIKALDDEGLGNVHICPETMGKINQLGNLFEVIELCKLDERLIPCIDFGHMNARTLGYYKQKAQFKEIFDEIENELGYERLKNFHSHFSKIEYSAGGEKKHLTFEDNVFGPDFEPVMELVYEKNLSPTFICESAGTQAKDALSMKKYYNGLDDNNG